jgi:hypothetical protein
VARTPNYVKDLSMLRFGRVDDGTMEFKAAPIESVQSADVLRLSKTIGSSDERIDVARLEGRMTGVGNDLESRFRPGAMQIPGIRHRTNNVVPTLDDHSRQVSNPIDVLQQVIVSIKEAMFMK